jgi:hypothetical protein
MSNDKGIMKAQRIFVIRTFGLISSFVIKISSLPSSSNRLTLRLRVPV